MIQTLNAKRTQPYSPSSSIPRQRKGKTQHTSIWHHFRVAQLILEVVAVGLLESALPEPPSDLSQGQRVIVPLGGDDTSVLSSSSATSSELKAIAAPTAKKSSQYHCRSLNLTNHLSKRMKMLIQYSHLASINRVGTAMVSMGSPLDVESTRNILSRDFKEERKNVPCIGGYRVGGK